MSDRLELIENLTQELLKGQREVRRDLKCIVDTWAEFQSNYGEHLKQSVRREKDRAELRKAIIEKGLILALVAVVGFVATASWHEVQSVFMAAKK